MSATDPVSSICHQWEEVSFPVTTRNKSHPEHSNTEIKQNHESTTNWKQPSFSTTVLEVLLAECMHSLHREVRAREVCRKWHAGLSFQTKARVLKTWKTSRSVSPGDLTRPWAPCFEPMAYPTLIGTPALSWNRVSGLTFTLPNTFAWFCKYSENTFIISYLKTLVRNHSH